MMLLNCKENDKFQGVPRNYFYQLQTQMMATGADVAYLVRYLTTSITDEYGNKYEFDLEEKHRLFFARVYPDQDVFNAIIEKVEYAESLKQKYIGRFFETI
jgi:tRNA-dihydrouridine synthase